jgi:hypothetical protein
MTSAVTLPAKPAPRRLFWLAVILACVAVVLSYVFHNALNAAFFAVTGAKDEAGPVYGTWSGFAGGLQVFEWIALGCLIYWRGTCHASPWCLRHGKYEAAGGMFKLCGHHHPDVGSRKDGESHLEMIHRLHFEHKARL